MNNYNIYAFSDEASFDMDKQIAALKRNGLCGPEIRFVDGPSIVDITLDKAKEVRKKLDANGLRVWTLGSPIGKIKLVEDSFEEHLEKLKHILEVGNILGAENIRMFSFFLPEKSNFDDYANEVIDKVGKMAEITIKAGIHPCHENEKAIFGDTAERCMKLLTELPILEGIFDPANFIQCGQDTMEAWRMLNPFIKYLHIKDAFADGSVVPAGKGIGRVPEIVADYVKKGGKCFTVEPHLTVFSGLDSLETGDKKSGVGIYKYPDSDTAFDVACNSLKEILNNIK